MTTVACCITARNSIASPEALDCSRSLAMNEALIIASAFGDSLAPSFANSLLQANCNRHPGSARTTCLKIMLANRQPFVILHLAAQEISSALRSCTQDGLQFKRF